MPIIASAKKKLRQDKKRNRKNRHTKDTLKIAISEALNKPQIKTIQKAYSAIDTASKKHLIHKNKANRLKSQVAKVLSATKTTSVKPATAKTKSK